MSADEKATDERPAALLPMNERRDMLCFLDMQDLLTELDEIRRRQVSSRVMNSTTAKIRSKRVKVGHFASPP
jgi:hypothetical protein